MAAVTEATGSRGIVRVSGPALAGVLAKGVNLDLHPDAFPDGTAAVTAIAHMSVHLWRIGDSFELSIARSFAGSFWSWLSASAAEYGCEVR